MADKALVALRGARQDAVAVTRESQDAVALGCTVELALPHGILIQGDQTRFNQLAERGYWVRTLRATNILKVGQFQIDIDAPAPAVPPGLQVPIALEATWPHHLLQLAGPPIEPWIKAITDTGAVVVSRISEYGLFVSASTLQLGEIRALKQVAWLGPFKPAYRLSPMLKEITGTVEHLVVLTHPATAVDEVVNRIEALGGSVASKKVSDGFGRVVATLAADHIAEISRLPQVASLDSVPPGIRPLDERTCQIVSGGAKDIGSPGYDPRNTFDVDGTGVIIAIADTGIDATHADFNGRVFAQEAFDPASNPALDALGHGTAVAGVAAGNPSAASSLHVDADGFALGQGVAPAAALVSIKIYKDAARPGGPDFPEDLPATRVDEWIARAVARGASIMNNSWEYDPPAPADGGRFYGEVCRKIDTAVRASSLVVVCGAGNSFPRKVLTPGVAKNVITVGASWSDRQPTLAQQTGQGSGGAPASIDDVWANSGSGPSLSGRLLPTLVAPGSYIVSAAAKCAESFVEPNLTAHNRHAMGGHLLVGGSTTCTVGPIIGGVSGTSYAAPHVAGACALLIESWWQRSGGRLASPALLKAWLVNGAVNPGITQPALHVPNMRVGWGRISLASTLISEGGQKLFVDQTHRFQDPADAFHQRVIPLDPGKPLRVTLVWTDPPVGMDTDGILAHKLDLEVEEEETGSRYLGNANFVSGFSTIGPNPQPDDVNNIKCVYLQNPRGAYTIRVTPGLAVSPADAQDFALVVENAELIARAPASIVTLIDRSGSVSGAGFERMVKAATKAFISNLSPGGEIGVVSVSDAASVESNLTQTDAAARQASKVAVDAIAFGGCTFMGDGIAQSKQLLTPAQYSTTAIVLVSDGHDNQGCQPGSASRDTALAANASLPTLPIYACALGPTSNQTMLQDLAEAHNGIYYHAADGLELFEVYGYMAAQIQGDEVIALERFTTATRTLQIPIDGSVSAVTFQISWINTILAWVAGPPKRNQIQVTLIDPQGLPWNIRSCHTLVTRHSGSLSVHIEQPPSGTWKVVVRRAVTKRTICFVGVFARSSQSLVVAAAKTRVKKKELIRLAATGFMVPPPAGFLAKVAATVVKPSASLDTVSKAFGKLLTRQSAPKALTDDGVPRSIAKLVALHLARSGNNGAGIFKTTKSKVRFVKKSKANAFVGTKSTPTTGTYNFVVTATLKGKGKFSTPVVRKKLVSVLVVP